MPGKKMKFRRVAMVKPNSESIYAPSRIITDSAEKEFTNTGYTIKVSFAKDGVSNPQPRVAYADGLDCWYILDE